MSNGLQVSSFVQEQKPFLLIMLTSDDDVGIIA